MRNIISMPLVAIAALLLALSQAESSYYQKQTGGGGAVDSVNGQTGVVVLDAADVDALPETGSGLVEELNGMIETVDDKTYILVEKARYARQVTKIALICTSGSVTAALKINGTNITTCNGINVTTSISDTTCDTGSSNNLAAGDVLTLVTTSNSSCENLGFTVETVRD